MKRIVRATFCFVFLSTIAALLFCTAYPQTRKYPSEKRSASTKISNDYDQNPFDDSISSLPPHYDGHDLQAVFDEMKDKVNRLNEAKSGKNSIYAPEYKAELQRPVTGQLLIDSTYAFKFDVKSRHDSNRHLLKISIPIVSPSVPGGVPGGLTAEARAGGVLSSILWSVVTGKHSNLSRDFNSKEVFEADARSAYVLHSENYYQFPAGPKSAPLTELSIVFPVKRSIPLSLRNRLRLLVLCKIQRDSWINGMGTAARIHEEPILVGRYYLLRSEWQQVWLYNYDTGEIYKKVVVDKNKHRPTG